MNFENDGLFAGMYFDRKKMKPKATKKVDFYLQQFLLKNSLKLKMHFAIWMMFVTQ